MGLEQAIAASLAVEKQMNLALAEALELTQELLDSLSRQDEVSVRLNLSLRQEPIDRLHTCQEALRRQAAGLPPLERDTLRGLLNGEPPPPGNAAAQELAGQVARNRGLLERVVQADRTVSRRLGGQQSFYQQKK